ncbi:MAG TPA: flavin reductase [Bacteroidetes bacterium]|jgi:flavin reductase (DIM6/NTAB) family NADH-FMN oxidoreductase RutF|nr:flavin reductase [Bacteroidota bacterium]|tara:strand:+ start:4604 stop:5452 length:849 start_codon:yes stop_codon:yes gene_type:complete
MVSLDPKELSVPILHQYLLGSIGPRPIAFASTVDKEGNRNLAPFSFFNVFSANPPILIFSPARSGRMNTTKDTHNNVKEVAEVVINVVTYDMVHQMSLASSPFEAGVDEFEKAGFTPVASDTIRPFRVKESPVQLECKVLEVKELGENGGAGNLVICEVLKIHISESVLDQKGMIDQEKIDLVSRMGGNWYCRANGESLFEVDKPLTAIGIGVDALPAKIKMCKELTGNDLGILGNLQSIPNDEEMTHELTNLSENLSIRFAKQLLTANKPITAYAVLSKLL